MSNTIPRSKVKLYVAPDLIESKNLIIDDIEIYLASLTSSTELECQYIKHEQRIKLKLNMYEDKQTNLAYTYCKIVNTNEAQDEKKVYYYVDNIKPVAQNTIELELICDGLNTYNGNRTFKNTTHVTRKHKDRFVLTTGDPDISKAMRVIDRPSEQLNFLESEKKFDKSIEDTKTGEKNWYLVYRSTGNSTVNPIKTYLVSDGPTKVFLKTGYHGTGDLSKTTFFLAEDQATVSAKITYVMQDFSHAEFKLGAEYTFKSRRISEGADEFWQGRILGVYNFEQSSVGSFKKYNLVRLLVYDIARESQVNLTFAGFGSDITYPTYIKGAFDDTAISGSKGINIIWINSYVDHYREGNDNTTIQDNIALIKYYYELKAIEIEDSHTQAGGLTSAIRVDTQTSKIVKCPYCPLKYEIKRYADEDYYNFNAEVALEVDSGTFYHCMVVNQTGLPTLNIDTLESTPFNQLIVDLSNEDKIENKNLNFESKLYHSDFYKPEFYCDSFINVINCEDLYRPEPDVGVTPVIYTNYIISKSLGETCGFSNRVNEGWAIKDRELFSNYTVISRNNDEIVYNSAYLDYIKNGYNYDKKQQALAIEQAGVGVITSVGTGIVGGGLKGGVAGAIAGAVVGAVKGGISLYQTAQSQNNAMQAKLAALAKQKVNITSSNELDMLEWYQGDNKVHFAIFDIPEYLKNQLYDYLYNYGYINNSYEVPTHNNRIWFDFLQCEPEFTYDIAIDKAIRQDIENRYKEGVTYIHKYNNTYDLTFTKENWETWLVSYLQD